MIHGFKIQQDEPFAQVTRDLNTQGFAHSDFRWLSQIKVNSAEKNYISIVVTISKKALHQQLLDSSEIYLDGQWHTMCAFNYIRPPMECVEDMGRSTGKGPYRGFTTSLLLLGDAPHPKQSLMDELCQRFL